MTRPQAEEDSAASQKHLDKALPRGPRQGTRARPQPSHGKREGEDSLACSETAWCAAARVRARLERGDALREALDEGVGDGLVHHDELDRRAAETPTRQVRAGGATQADVHTGGPLREERAAGVAACEA
eukprot:2804556-Pleurochrysis_carterae.AAC.3